MYHSFHNNGCWQEAAGRTPKFNSIIDCKINKSPDIPKELGGWNYPKPAFAYRNGTSTTFNCRSNLPEGITPHPSDGISNGRLNCTNHSKISNQ